MRLRDLTSNNAINRNQYNRVAPSSEYQIDASMFTLIKKRDAIGKSDNSFIKSQNTDDVKRALRKARNLGSVVPKKKQNKYLK